MKYLSYLFEVIKTKLKIPIFNFDKKNTKFLVRVDDFPHWTKTFDDFIKFDSIMKEYNIPYILGVTPYIAKNPFDVNCNSFRKLTSKEISYLHDAINENRITIGLHGFTHKTNSRKEFSEYKFKNFKDIKKNVIDAKKMMNEYGFETNIFIPPYNSFFKENLEFYSKHFNVITGGPESIKEMGKLEISYINNTLYIPSYYPNYIHPKYYKKIDYSKSLDCITIHWTWFNENELRYILDKIKNNVIDLNELKEAVRK